MAQIANITGIPATRVQLIDPRTQNISREWYNFFFNLYQLAGNGSNSFSISDLQVSPPVPSQFNTENQEIDPSPFQVGSISSFNLQSNGTTGQVLTSTQTSDLVWEDPLEYLEGIWTPEFSGSSSDPMVTYDSQIGEYIQIGNLIQASASITWSSFSGGSGDFYISLPFQVLSPSSSGGVISFMDGVTLTTGTFSSVSTIDGEAKCKITSMGSGISTIIVSVGDIDSLGKIDFNVTYRKS